MNSDNIIINKNKFLATIITLVVFSSILLFTFFYSFFSPTDIVSLKTEFEISGFGTTENQKNINQKNSQTQDLEQSISFKQQVHLGSNSSVVINNQLEANSESKEATSESIENSPSLSISDSNKSGYGIDLNGRKIVFMPILEKDATSEGKVVVDILVDENGIVINADPSGRGSTTSNPILKEKAKRAALSTKFNSSADYKEQKGTITIIFSF